MDYDNLEQYNKHKAYLNPALKAAYYTGAGALGTTIVGRTGEKAVEAVESARLKSALKIADKVKRGNAVKSIAKGSIAGRKFFRKTKVGIGATAGIYAAIKLDQAIKDLKSRQ